MGQEGASQKPGKGLRANERMVKINKPELEDGQECQGDFIPKSQALLDLKPQVSTNKAG